MLRPLGFEDEKARSTRSSPELCSSNTSVEDEESRSSNGATGKVGNDEGGLHAWLTVVGSCLVYFASFGIVNSFGFFQTYYEKNLLVGVPASTISFVGTIQLTLLNLLAAPAGSLYDCYGLKALYICSGISCVGALICLSFVHAGSLWQIIVIQGVLLGIATSFGTQPALAVAGHYFVRRRGLVFGIVAAAGSVGGVCFPVILTRLAAMPSTGFPGSLRVVALIVVCCYALALWISRPKQDPKSFGSWTSLVDFEGFRDLRYSVLAAGAFVAMLGQFIPYYYIGSYTMATNSQSPAIDYLLPLMNASSFLGRIIGGFASDTIGPANTTYPMTIFSGLLCLGTWAITSSVPVLIGFVSLYGFCSGVFIAVLPAIIAQLVPAAKLGSRIGAFYSACAVAQLVGSPIGGALIRTKKDGGNSADAYLGLILFAGTTLVVGGILILGSRLLHDRSLSTRH